LPQQRPELAATKNLKSYSWKLKKRPLPGRFLYLIGNGQTLWYTVFYQRHFCIFFLTYHFIVGGHKYGPDAI
jgi:expansin (peptidoglycan-binding protein)